MRIGGCRLWVLGIGMAVTMALAGVGCSIELVPETQGWSDDEATLKGMVLVRFWNRTVEEAVDVQFYATNEPLGTFPDDLFVDENRVTRSIGLGGRGIIGPATTDAITFPCTEDLSLGTLGGEFSEAETGDQRGLGTARWAQDAPLGLCGSVVTFEFYRDGDEYRTRLQFGD